VTFSFYQSTYLLVKFFDFLSFIYLFYYYYYYYYFLFKVGKREKELDFLSFEAALKSLRKIILQATVSGLKCHSIYICKISACCAVKSTILVA
jgi:hypothetical protein